MNYREINERSAAWSVLFGLIGIALFIAGAIGYVLNIVKLFGLLSGEVTAMFIMRLVGLIPFVGAILGWF